MIKKSYVTSFNGVFSIKFSALIGKRSGVHHGSACFDTALDTDKSYIKQIFTLGISMCQRSGNFDLAFYLLLEILIYDFRKIYPRLQSISL